MFVLDSVLEVCDHPTRGPRQLHSRQQTSALHPGRHSDIAAVLHVVADLPPSVDPTSDCERYILTVMSAVRTV